MLLVVASRLARIPYHVHVCILYVY
jgi:hypothetical protein